MVQEVGDWVIFFKDSLKELNDTMQVLASEAYSSASAPVQYAAIAAYETDQSKFLNHSKKILNLISDYCYKKLILTILK